MTPLRFIDEDADDSYRWDVDFIVATMRERGYEVSRQDARKAWEAYSESMAAGWMSLTPFFQEGSSDEEREQAKQDYVFANVFHRFEVACS